MPNLYYRISDPSDVRDLGEQMAAWVAAGNPKANDWAVQSEAPSVDAVWQDGAWVTPPQPTQTAEEYISQTLSPFQILGLQRLEMALLSAGKPLGPHMSAMQQWLEGLLLSWSADPTPKPADQFAAAPSTYEAAAAEAVGDLQSN